VSEAFPWDYSYQSSRTRKAVWPTEAKRWRGKGRLEHRGLWMDSYIGISRYPQAGGHRPLIRRLDVVAVARPELQQTDAITKAVGDQHVDSGEDHCDRFAANGEYRHYLAVCDANDRDII